MSRGLARFELAGARWWTPAPVDDLTSVRSRIEEALVKLHEATNLKSGRRKELYRIGIKSEKPDHLLKIRRYDRGARLSQRARPSRSRRELERAVAIAARGIPTPAPLAAGEERRFGLLTTCYLLVPVVPGAVELTEAWRAPGTPARRRHELARALGRLARRLHDAGVFQEDFAPNNFLVAPAGEAPLLPIDFERARLRRRIGERERAFMLAKLDRYFAGVGAAQRMRFLRAYTDGDRNEARAWWGRVRETTRSIVRADLRRLERTATRDGRRYRRVEVGGWQGWARRDATPPEDLPTAAAGIRPLAGREPQVEEREDHWLWHAEGLGRREARDLWVRAQLLYRYRLSPRPLVLLHRDGSARLWLERPEGARRLDQARDARRARAATAVLIDRLSTLGDVEEIPDAHHVALVPAAHGFLQAMLLEPSSFRP